MVNLLLDELRFPIEPIGKEKVEELEPLLNFLFIVHNEVEMSEMQKTLTPLNGFGVILDYVEEECMQHFYLGSFFKYHIVLAKTSDMGGRNVNSVINVINRAIQIFRPRYIIMPGIAAGLDDHIKIGDVVIADKIIGYESEKIAPAEIIGRYPEFRSPRLFNLFCSANVQTFNLYLQSEIQRELRAGTKPKPSPDCNSNCPRDAEEEFCWGDFIKSSCFPKVYTGNYISGEKLLDNAFYRSYLKASFKEVLALDMEGVGVASASTFNRVYDWLVIKGISDLGDGNKAQHKVLRQIYAMKNVILVLKKVFDDEHSFPENTLKQAKGFVRKSVLISASQCQNGAYYDLTPVFMEALSKQLIINQYKVITGYGLGVGPSILFGIFEGCSQLHIPLQEYIDRFHVFAFPRSDSDPLLLQMSDERFYKKKLDACKSKNREMLCSNADVVIFAFGQKFRNGEVQVAEGMFEELELVVKNKALILPVGCTGGTAQMIYDTIASDVDYYLKPYFSERNRYRAVAISVDDAIQGYLDSLRSLNNVEMTERNVNHIVSFIIKIINLFG